MPILRFSDDGEPQGTAGKPILEVINGSEIHNICIVVTRYFGGTLLGTGGLVRAYTDASKAALEVCETKLMQRLLPVEILIGYTDLGKVQYILNSNNINILDTEFSENVLFKTEIPYVAGDRIMNEITEATGARAVIELGDETFG